MELADETRPLVSRGFSPGKVRLHSVLLLADGLHHQQADSEIRIMEAFFEKDPS